jgi:ABC-type transport system involved in multi-copper enzyme maturation permease subunit
MTREERITARLLSSGLLNFGAGIVSSFLISWYFTPKQALVNAANIWWFGLLFVGLVCSFWAAYVFAHKAEQGD